MPLVIRAFERFGAKAFKRLWSLDDLDIGTFEMPEATSIGMLLFPRLTILDLAGPYEVFARMPATRVHLVGLTAEPIASESGLAITPDTLLDEAPPFDVLFVPGGNGVNEMLADERCLAFLEQQGKQARYVTSVCTGALLLGAAGLLRGYRATTHWLSLDLLPLLGAEPVAERVVVDRNRITGGGITAGIDFGLTLAALLHGESVAEEIQLMIEYDPRPPLDCGSPQTADKAVVERVRSQRRPVQEDRRRKIEHIVSRWV
jgi:cyclohexyl-isocyanide hydratase